MKMVKNIEYVDPDTFYDFSVERAKTNVLGGYTVMKSPASLFTVNMIGIVCTASLYSYGVVAGFYTMIYIARDKSEMVQAFYGMGLMGVAIGFLVVKNLIADKSLKKCVEYIQEGVYQYHEPFSEEFLKIKRHRIRRVRFLVTFVSNGMYFCAFSNTFIPLVQLLLAGGDFSDDELNPFLPLHLYVPFDTRTTLGFSLVFIASGFIMFTMYATFGAHAQLYLSTTLQLTAELEVLNFSLRNLEKRAYLIFKRKNGTATDHGSIPHLYDDPGYQKCLYSCLRDNIRHHLAILRFRDTISPYLGRTVTVVLLFFSLLMAAGIIILLENSRPQLTLLTDLFGFFPLCWVGQQVLNESALTKHALFDTPWPSCDEKFKVLLKVFYSNVQKPVIMKARGFNINLCLETFADMVSVGYKIMNVMR